MPEGALAEIHVARLGVEDETRMLCDLLGASSVEPEIVGAIRARSCGNPFVSRELAIDLRRRGGWIDLDDQGRATAGDDFKTARDGLEGNGGVSLPLPESILATALAGVSDLAPDLLLIAKVAACVGMRFDVATLAAVGPVLTGEGALGSSGGAGTSEAVGTVHGDAKFSRRSSLGTWDDEALCARCITLDRMHIIRLSEGPDGLMSFTSALLREGLYSTLPYAQREAVHAALANHLWPELLRAKSGTHDEARVYALIGSHLLRAGKESEARACLKRASQIAQGLNDVEWARLLLAKASSGP